MPIDAKRSKQKFSSIQARKTLHTLKCKLTILGSVKIAIKYAGVV